MSSKVIQLDSLAALKMASVEFAKQLRGRDLVLLSGPMGSGKTTFVRYLVEVLGGGSVSSPTFGLHQTYDTKNGLRVDHFDLYRLQHVAELEGLGWEEIFDQVKGLVFVEWADRVHSSFWPKDWTSHEVRFAFQGEQVRQLIIDSKTDHRLRMKNR